MFKRFASSVHLLCVAAIALGTSWAQTSGTVWSWGRNNTNQLGDGTNVDSATPVQALNLTGIGAVAAGSSHTLAAKSDGTLWSWGSNNYGELGIGVGCPPCTGAPAPIQVSSISGVTGVAAGSNFSLALKSNGTVWAWGDNTFGQLGNGTDSSTVPIQVLNLSGVTAIAAGYAHGLALKSDGTVWAWGYNAFGRLGDGTTTNRFSPVQVSNLTGVVAIAAGQNHSLALRSDGTAWGWGNNQYGQLATGALTATEAVPVQAKSASGFVTGVARIAGGGQQTVALQTDGTVLAWGSGLGLQSGTGTNLYNPPTVFSGFAGGTAVAATINSISALKSDGTVWTWGTLPFGPATNGALQLFTSANALGPSSNALHGVLIAGPSNGPTVVSIAVTPLNSTIASGSTQQYKATATYSDGSTKDITTGVAWTCSDTSIATINAAGLATGSLAGGPVAIRATQGSVTGSASLTVTTVMAAISITPVNTSVSSGATLSYTAIGTFTDGTQKNITASVTWSSSDPTIASINASGVATGVKPGGPVTIRATQGGIVSNGAILTVVGALVSISVTPVNASILAGATQAFTAIATYSDGSAQNITSAVTWSTSDPAVATITAAGIARGLKAGGPVTIRATQGVVVSNDAFLTVTKVLVSMVVTPFAAIVGPGKTQQFTATGTYNDGSIGPAMVTWTSWDPSVATIDAAGLATGKKASRTITVRATQGTLSAIASLTVAAPGNVWAWGSNILGQLGNGTGANAKSNVPIQAYDPTPSLVVATGSNHSLAIHPDGTVFSWGNNQDGELGDGTKTSRTSPAPVSGLGGVAGIAGGQSHSLALKSDGAVWAWGGPFNGVLGNGTLTGSTLPVLTTISGVVAVAAGLSHNLALKQDGTVWAWGNGFYGQLGTGTNADSYVPVQVRGLTGIVAIAAGDLHSYALKSDGTVWAWGYNASGQLGNGTNTNTNTPVQVNGLASVAAIAGGGFHGLATAFGGTVWGWGDNQYGQLGCGDSNNRNTPIAIAAFAGATVVAGASFDTVALRPDGTLWATGANFTGQLGNASGVATTNLPMPVVKLSGVLFIPSRYLGFHSLAILPAPVSITVTPSTATIAVGTGQRFTATGTYADGSTRNITDLVVWLAVDPFTVRIGQSGLALGLRPSPPTNVYASTVAVGSSPAALTVIAAPSGTAWSWGDGASGALGNGSSNNSNVPVAARGLDGVVALATGDSHTLAVKKDGTVWSWGANDGGQLGNPGVASTTLPTLVGGISGVLAVAAGSQHSIALKSDGTVWTWGWNQYGQLCTGSGASQSNVPVQVNGLSNVVAIAAGFSFTVALKFDGTVWTCGSNNGGELGDTTTNQSAVPVQAAALTGVVAIASGSSHTLALRFDGTVWGFGFAGFGELGSRIVTPKPVNNVADALAVAAGGFFSRVLHKDGTVWSVGRNEVGQLGNGSLIDSSIPVQAANIADAVAIAGGYAHGLALTSGRTLWAWGSNNAGEVGTGNYNSPLTSPIRVANLAGVVAIGAGPLALRSVAIAPNTQAGANVVVQPVTRDGTTPVTLTFSNITQLGDTSATVTQSGPPPPPGYKLGQPPIYFDLTTTAVYSGPIQVCIDFSRFVFNAVRNLRIMHYEGGTWVDRTTSIDLANRMICGAVSSLSPFGVFEPGDSTPPTTRAVLSPAANATGWNNSDVTVTLTAVDDTGGAGVKQVTYSATGAQTVASTTNSSSSASLVIKTEGVTNISYFATDHAGNAEAPHTLTIKLDKTPPRLTCTANPGQLWPPNNKLADIHVSVGFSDALSGAAGFTLVSATNNEMDSGAGDIQGWNIGTPDVMGQLRAQRSGEGSGRVYTLTYHGADLAGNSATCTATVTVPHDQGQ